MHSGFVKSLVLVVLSLFLFLGGLGIWAMYNQRRVFERIKALINENLHGTLEARDFRFSPLTNGLGFTFSLFDVTLHDTLYPQHRTHLLEARRLNVTLDLSDFFGGNIRVKNLRAEQGTLFVFTRRDGYSNLSIFTDPRQAVNSMEGDKSRGEWLKGNKQLSFRDFTLRYTDSLKEKYFEGTLRDISARVIQRDSVWKGTMDGDLYVKQLLFKSSKRGFMNNQATRVQLRYSYNDTDKILLIRESEITLSTKNRLGVSGTLDFRPRPGQVTLHITTDRISAPVALKLLPERLEEQIARTKILPVVRVDLTLRGSLGPGRPRVDLKYATERFDLKRSFGDLRGITAVGTFTNQVNPAQQPSDANSRLSSTRFTGYYETIPLEGTLVINDLKTIGAVLEVTLKARPEHLNALLDPRRYRVNGGTADIRFRYQGSLKTLYDPQTNRPTARVGGTADLRNLSVSYLPRKVNLRQITGLVTFDEEEFRSKNLRFSDGKNTFFVQGTSVGLLAQALGASAAPRATLQVKVADWQLDWLDFFLKKKDPDQPTKNSKFRMAKTLDQIIDKTEVVASLESNRVLYRQFSATRVRGTLSLTDTRVQLSNFSMNALGGSLNLSGYIHNIGRNGLPYLHAEGRLTNTQVQEVFYSMSNFGQTALTHDNLKGKLNADFTFETTLRDNTSLVAETMRGRLGIALTGAEVVNFEPFQKINSIVFKNRSLDRVRFAPIRREFVLKGQEIEVQEMEIESNVMTLFVDGTYSFGNKTDLSIQLPLRNLKRRDSTYQLTQHNMEFMKGSNVFLRAVDEGGKVTIKYDPFKRIRRNRESRADTTKNQPDSR
jgi:hypothetical protein